VSQIIEQADRIENVVIKKEALTSCDLTQDVAALFMIPANGFLRGLVRFDDEIG